MGTDRKPFDIRFSYIHIYIYIYIYISFVMYKVAHHM